MDPDLALSAVEYAIQLALHIKQTIKAYHANPSQYENLISRFRNIRTSLRIITESNNVDFQSPVWGRAFRRIRDDFESAAETLKEIHAAIQSSPLLRLFHARQTSKKLSNLDCKIDVLQRDLDLLGFFTFSNASTTLQSDIVLHNVQDVKSSLLLLESRLQSLEQKLQRQNFGPDDRTTSLPFREEQNGQNYDQGSFQERIAEYKENVRKLYQQEVEKPREQEEIMKSISTLQARVKKYAAPVIETLPSETKSNLISETCERLLNQWNLDNGDIQIVSNGLRHHSSRSAVYEGSVTIRGLWQYPTREARVAIKVVPDVQNDGQLNAILRRVVALREINHPNIVSFYGACWPDIEAYRRNMDYQKMWRLRHTLLVAELMTHNLAEAIKIPALSDFDTKLMVLASISNGVEYLHQRGLFRIALTTKHVMLRIIRGEVVGEAKLSSLWSSYEDMRKDEESLYEEAAVLKSRAPIFHQDTFNFGILMCFVLSSKVDHSSWDDRVFTRMESASNLETVLEQARKWVRGIEPPFLKELAKRCIFNDKISRPSFKFIRKCIEGLLKNESLPDLSTQDCGEGIRRQGKNIFYGKEGFVASPSKAVPFFERAVSCGNVAALVNLGNCYFYGLGTQKNIAMGFELFRAAAFAGNAGGQLKLGMFFHSGLPGSLRADVLFAAEMYRRAATQGNPSAQFRLGCYKYYEEIGNLYHIQEAATLWKLSASEGHRIGQYFLGRCFEQGTGVQRDIAAAMIWYGRAAAQGHFGGKWALQRLSDPNPLKSSPPKEGRTEAQIT